MVGRSLPPQPPVCSVLLSLSLVRLKVKLHPPAQLFIHDAQQLALTQASLMRTLSPQWSQLASLRPRPKTMTTVSFIRFASTCVLACAHPPSPFKTYDYIHLNIVICNVALGIGREHRGCVLPAGSRPHPSLIHCTYVPTSAIETALSSLSSCLHNDNDNDYH